MIAALQYVLVLVVLDLAACAAAQLAAWAMHQYTLLGAFNLYPLVALGAILFAAGIFAGAWVLEVASGVFTAAALSAAVAGARRRMHALNAGGSLREHELSRRWAWQPGPVRAAGEHVRLGRQGEVTRIKPWSPEVPYVSMRDPSRGSRLTHRVDDRGPRLPLGEGRHVFLVGATGAGKTTTARRLLAARVLAQRSSLVILDQKGDAQDVEEMRRLAAAAGVPFVLFDSQDPETDRWQPLWGTPSTVAARAVEAIKQSEPYYYDCAEAKPSFTKTYTGQIGIPGTGFADSGDSGALVLDASNAQAVGLLFASGSGNNGEGLSVANPIQDVLSELSQKSQAEGQQFQIVGGAPHPITCANYDQSSGTAVAPGLNPAQAAQARAAADSAAAMLMRPDNGILGTGTGRSLDAPEEPAVFLYADETRLAVAVPKIVNGLRTVVVRTDAAGVGTVMPAAPSKGIELPADVLQAAAQVQRQYAPKLMRDPAFFGVGITQSYDNPSEAALLVLVDKRMTPQSMPDTVGNLRVRYLTINRLHVTRSKYTSGARPTSCRLREARR